MCPESCLASAFAAGTETEESVKCRSWPSLGAPGAEELEIRAVFSLERSGLGTVTGFSQGFNQIVVDQEEVLFRRSVEALLDLHQFNLLACPLEDGRPYRRVARCPHPYITKPLCVNWFLLDS